MNWSFFWSWFLIENVVNAVTAIWGIWAVFLFVLVEWNALRFKLHPFSRRIFRLYFRHLFTLICFMLLRVHRAYNWTAIAFYRFTIIKTLLFIIFLLKFYKIFPTLNFILLTEIIWLKTLLIIISIGIFQIFIFITIFLLLSDLHFDVVDRVWLVDNV